MENLYCNKNNSVNDSIIIFYLNRLYEFNDNYKQDWENLLISIINSQSFSCIIYFFNQKIINEPSNPLTLDIIDFLIDYGPIELIRELANISFMNNILNLLKKSSSSGSEVQKKVIYLVNKWNEKNKEYPNENFKGFINNYNQLRNHNITFPPPGYQLFTYEIYISQYEASIIKMNNEQNITINKINYKLNDNNSFNHNENISTYNSDNNRKKEVETDISKLNKVDKNLINVFPSVCKIIFKNKIGSGFLLKLKKDNKDLFCLMTNEHVITKEMIDNNETINIYYNNENKKLIITLNSVERFIKYNKKYDITIIEILSKDNINEDYFLLPYTDEINNLKNERIYIPQFPKGELSYSKGYIKEINEYELIYTASTNKGSSGSPIFLENSKNVIGIHKEGNSTENENYGSLLNPIIQSLQKDNIKEENNLYIWKNGDYYLGPLLNGLPNGKGKKFFNNGIFFEGDFVSGKAEGYGKYIYKNGKYYIGQVLNNMKHGKGKLFDKNGNIEYEGDFINDKVEGYGKYIYEDGNYYIGQFLNNQRHGKGKYFDKNGNIEYEGDFVNDIVEGYGKYIYEDGGYYIGQLLDNKRHGKGKLFYKNGNLQYEGEFVNGKLEGYGKYIYEDGDYFIGQLISEWTKTW